MGNINLAEKMIKMASLSELIMQNFKRGKLKI